MPEDRDRAPEKPRKKIYRQDTGLQDIQEDEVLPAEGESLEELGRLLENGAPGPGSHALRGGEEAPAENNNLWNMMGETSSGGVAPKKGPTVFDLMGEEAPRIKPDIRPAAVAVPQQPARLGLRLFLLFFGILVSIFLVLTVFLLYSTRNDALWLDLGTIPYRTETILYYTDEATGETGVYLTVPCNQNKEYTPKENIPDALLQAFVAVEDKKFYTHMGVDVKRTVFAVANEAVHAVTGSYIGGDSGRKQGASTINQQLVKNLTRDDEASSMAGYLRKIREMYRALALNVNYSKEDILHAYVNTISFTGNTAGVGAEAKKLHGKEVDQLTLAECAGLAGITRNPARYNPVTQPEAYLERRNYVLSLMLEEGFITQAEHDAAATEPLSLNYKGEPAVTYPVTSYFTDMVIEGLVEMLADEMGLSRGEAIHLYYNGGLRIYTTVSPTLQGAMEQIAAGNAFPAGAQAAMISLDYSGAVKGVVGGTGNKEVSLGFDRATDALRQVGSTIKPIGPYALALEKNKITWSSTFEDAPVETGTDADGNETAWPRNADGKYTGDFNTVRKGVAKSVNTVAVRVGQTVGERAVYSFLKNKLGIDSLVSQDVAPGPMYLGSITYGIAPLDMARAYAMFGNGGYTPGKAYTFTKLTGGTGRVFYEETPALGRALSADTAFIMNRLLRQVLVYGTAEGMSVSGSMDSVGKTGTTNDQRDYWFVGLTPYYVTAVWYGNDDAFALESSGGTRTAAAAWRMVMAQAQSGLPHRDFPTAKGVVEAEYCSETGFLPAQGCKTSTGWFKTGHLPKARCDGKH